jgi:aminopeptidase-like protein
MVRVTNEEINAENLFGLAQTLWPINRSITGEGFLMSLKILMQNGFEDMELVRTDSGSKVFDWTVPLVWNVREAYIRSPDGSIICNFQDNNLHLVGYSIPVNCKVSLSDLQNHLYSLPEQPNAIPYVTSYYEELWGFCISQDQREELIPGDYEVVIESTLESGSLIYGELFIPGETEEEVLISTYLCHPSMANNEISGPVVASALARWLKSLPSRKYSYRFVVVPETIGSICFINNNLENLKQKTVAGFNVSCVGDERTYSFLPSRHGNTLSDRAAKYALDNFVESYKKYDWRDRGSDERQYCSPGVDLPIASIMRSKYGTYPEYHTSLDTLGNVVTGDGLYGGFQIIRSVLEIIEINCKPIATNLCEPQLGKRNLYPKTSIKGNYSKEVKMLQDILSWCDGSNDLIDMARILKTSIETVNSLVKVLASHNLIKFG